VRMGERNAYKILVGKQYIEQLLWKERAHRFRKQKHSTQRCDIVDNASALNLVIHTSNLDMEICILLEFFIFPRQMPRR
jgi:hypothetical protein